MSIPRNKVSWMNIKVCTKISHEDFIKTRNLPIWKLLLAFYFIHISNTFNLLKISTEITEKYAEVYHRTMFLRSLHSESTQHF